MAEESGNEIIPLNEESQIALPETSHENQLALPQIRAEVVIPAGNFPQANFGPRHETVQDYTNATIVNNYYGAAEEYQGSSSTSNETGARPKQSQKPAIEEGYVQICSDIFIYNKAPLKRGTNVYKGYQYHVSGTRVPLAIKRISPYDDKNLREVGHLASLASHPNIVRIIRSVTREGIVPELYIAMELCSSQTFQDYLKENCEKNIPFDFDQTMTFTKQLVSGIKHIHRNKIAHRDLKPENILLSLDGEQIKVSDFGISKEIRDGNATKQTSIGEGTDGYRAPETFKSDDITQSADIFSLGLVMYPMWSNGKHAFGGDAHMRNPNIINNKGRDLSDLVISGTKENQLRNLIDWMLQPDPQKRPTIEQVAQHTVFKSGPSPPAEDNSNQASSSEQTGEKSSPQRPSSNISAEHPRSTTRFSAATQSNSPKKDPNNRSNLRKQPVEKLSPKRSAPEKTLTEEFQSALRLPSVSKKAPSKEGIVIFDYSSVHLQLFNPADNTLKQMQSFNEDMMTFRFTAVTLHDFIYVLMENKLVLRLKYFDERATWERMPDTINNHGWFPPATVMSGCIYVAGGFSQATETNAVEKFDPSSNKWSLLEKKNRATSNNALVVAQGFIFCIGGFLRGHNFLKELERFDPASSTWTFVAPMKQAGYHAAAVEFNGKIFVLGGSNGSKLLSSVEIYDPSTNTWSAMKNNMLKPRRLFSAFVINDDIYAVGGDKEANSIERYSSERDVWEEVQIQTKREIKFRISTKIQI